MTFARARRTLAALALSAVVVVPTSAATSPADPVDPEPLFVTADLDGDGVPESVTLKQISPGMQLLRVAMREEFLDAIIGDDTGTLPLSPPRVTDLDGDGRAELVVAAVLGANTVAFEVWRYDDELSLHPVTDEAGETWRLYEGGGVAAFNGYACTTPDTDDAHRMPYAVQTEWDESRPDQEPILYVGEVVTYDLTDGVARPVRTEPVEDATTDELLLRTDPATCAV